MQVDESEILPQLLRVCRLRGPPPGWPPQPHRAESCIIALHHRFTGRFRLGTQVVVDPPMPLLLVVAPGELHASYPTGPVDCHWCVVRWGLVRADGGGGLRLGGRTAPARVRRWRELTAAEAGEARQLLRDLAVLAGATTPTARLAAAGRLSSLLALWTRPAPGEVPAAEAYRQQIEHHACDGMLPLTELARRVGRDADHLGVLFRHAFGMTPIAYRQHVRLQRALAALTEGASVAAAARLAGVPDARYLARLFRRHYGATPRAMAAQHGLHA